MRHFFLPLLILIPQLSFGGVYPGNQWCSWWNQIFVGIDGGFTTGLSHAKDSFGVGVAEDNGNGIATNATALPGWHVEGKLGYEWCPGLRTDLSYTHYQLEYEWQTIFGIALTDTPVDFASTDAFEANLHVNKLLFNTSLHLERLFCAKDPCWRISPYLTGGIGIAWNHLHDIKEWSSVAAQAPPFFTATIQKKTKRNVAGRFGLGLLTYLSSCWCLDTGIHVTYIGTVQSGSSGVFTELTTGPEEFEIFPYTFKRNWLGSLYVGLQAQF